jgi:hypothetical protein
MPQEIKKRSEGEWGTLPANAASRNELSTLPASSGQYQTNAQQQNQPGSVNSLQPANYSQSMAQPVAPKQPSKMHHIRKGSTVAQAP